MRNYLPVCYVSAVQQSLGICQRTGNDLCDRRMYIFHRFSAFRNVGTWIFAASFVPYDLLFIVDTLCGVQQILLQIPAHGKVPDEI